MIVLAAYFGVAFAVSAMLTPVCRHIARRAGLVSTPKNDRWHRTPTALFGGVAIAVTTIGLGVAVGPDIRLWPLVAGGAAMALLGGLLAAAVASRAALWGYVDGNGVAHFADHQVDSRYSQVLADKDAAPGE